MSDLLRNKVDFLMHYKQDEVNCYEYFMDYPEKIAQSYMNRFHVINKLKPLSSYKKSKRKYLNLENS